MKGIPARNMIRRIRNHADSMKRELQARGREGRVYSLEEKNSDHCKFKRLCFFTSSVPAYRR